MSTTVNKGIPCPHCKSVDSEVKDSRQNQGGTIRRRRQCTNCGQKYTTLEQVVRTQKGHRGYTLSDSNYWRMRFLTLRRALRDMLVTQYDPKKPNIEPKLK